MGGNGKKAGLNVGAVVILPEGFKLAPKDKMSEELKAKTKGTYISPYSTKQDNIFLLVQLLEKKNQDIIFPLIAPNPETDKNAHYLKYPFYVGANRGRGQVYPSGEKSNNNVYVATASGKISEIERAEKGSKIKIEDTAGNSVLETLPPGLELLVKENDVVRKDQPLTV